MSPEKFRTFTDILFAEVGKTGEYVDGLIRGKMAMLRAVPENNGKSENELTDLARSEVVAEMMETAFSDTDIISRISSRLQQTDRSLWGRIKNFLKGLVEKLKAAYKDMQPDSSIARLASETIQNSEAILNAYADAAADAVVNYNLQDEQKNTAPEGVQYSLRGKTQKEITARYQSDVDRILNMQDTTQRQLIVGYTPSLYQDIGMPSLPLTIGSGHVYSAAKTEAEALQDGNYRRGVNYHGLGDTAVKNIYIAIQDPVMIIASRDVNKNTSPMRSTHSVVAIVDIGTAEKSLLVPIEITAERKVNGTRMDVNTISSVYERSVSNLVKEAIALENSGDVGVYYAKKEALTLPGAGVRFPVQLQQSIASNSIVHRFSEKVNMKISENTQSQQFKRWFGDWQNDPANASKVVNADGTPKVMYHGSKEQFTVFDRSKARSSGTFGKGFYFSDSQSHAGTYGNLYAVYLNIRNPVQYGNGYVTKSQVRKFLDAVADNEDYSIENYGTYDIDQILKNVMRGKSKVDTFQVLQDINVTAIGDMYVRYGGYDRDDAEKIITKWGSEIDLNISYEELPMAYKRGKITDSTLLNALMLYGGLDKEAATEKVAAYKWQKTHPGYDLEFSEIQKYTETIKEIGGSLESMGISPDVFQKYSSLYSQCKGENKREQVLSMIDSLPITSSQKDALYYASGYSKNTIRKTPWH